MDHVRPKDIDIYERDGSAWVAAGTGGVSTSARPGPLKGQWWRLTAGYDHDALLLVWNDYGDHWSWEPTRDMPLATFRAALAATHEGFVRL